MIPNARATSIRAAMKITVHIQYKLGVSMCTWNKGDRFVATQRRPRNVFGGFLDKLMSINCFVSFPTDPSIH
ncbi:Uncharacterized protein TCM_004745 [Theobroma cacao]|uniref:Uncharacterized protein n=1 Tax=Theobroma cacao TaxID=3641 RepID=A0A061DYY5_THECC|nr:Uncharacterized protein TCM_004745 [Theobroma cacao]